MWVIIVDKTEIITKTAYSKEGKKLGRIIEIVGSEKSIVQLRKPHAVIYVRRAWKVDLRIPLLLKKVLKIDEKKVWFDISREAFELKIQDADHQKRSEKTAKGRALQKRLAKGGDRGYYHKKEKGEW